MSACPCCGQPMPTAEEAVARRVAELEAACLARGHIVTADGRVREHVAAELLARAPGTLRNWATSGGPLSVIRVAGRRTYRLTEVATMLIDG